MNRDFRFRLWDGEKMRYLDTMMVGVGQLGFSDDFWIDLNDEPWLQEKSRVMQFTGVVDRSRKPIFEGDVVRSGSKSHGHKFVVEWKTIYEYGEDDPFEIAVGFNVAPHSPNTYEIIGNVWDNPELRGHHAKS